MLLFLDALHADDSGYVSITFSERSFDPKSSPSKGLGLAPKIADNALRARIEFCNHVSCAKTEERYDEFPNENAQPFDGQGRFCVYDQSPLINYVRSVTAAWHESWKPWFDGAIRHYRFYADTAMVDVVTDQTPVLLRLRS